MSIGIFMNDLPVITVFCPVTRAHYLKRWFADLYSTDLVPEMTNLVFIIDGNYPNAYAYIMEEMNHTQFRKFLILRNYDYQVNEGAIAVRRKRIAEVHEMAKGLVASCDGEYVLALEDDTVFTNLCVYSLYEPFNPKVGTEIHSMVHGQVIGLVSAYQAGRWSQKIIGIWQFDDVHNPKECWTDLPKHHYEEITAAGFYCYLTPRSLFLDVPNSTDVTLPWGPDVEYGLALRKMGYTNYVNWDAPTGHQDQSVIISPNGQLISERFVKTELGWEHRRIV